MYLQGEKGKREKEKKKDHMTHTGPSDFEQLVLIVISPGKSYQLSGAPKGNPILILQQKSQLFAWMQRRCRAATGLASLAAPQEGAGPLCAHRAELFLGATRNRQLSDKAE